MEASVKYLSLANHGRGDEQDSSLMDGRADLELAAASR